MIISQSVEHPSKPISTGMFATVRGVIGVQGNLIMQNPYGAGTICYEIREIDLAGSIPKAAIKGMSSNMPIKSFEVM